jgi:hypothetical protein
MKANSSHKAFMPPIYEDFFESRVAIDSPWYTEAGILEVLVKGLDLDATDPRDKIFAMLQSEGKLGDWVCCHRNLSLITAGLLLKFSRVLRGGG